MALEKFSELPLTTWQWLGVNESHYPESLASAKEKTETIRVVKGEKRTIFLVNRSSKKEELIIHIEDNASVRLVQAQLAPANDDVTGKIKVIVAKDATLEYTSMLLGGQSIRMDVQVELIGDNAKVDMWSLYFGIENQVIDLNYVICQLGKNTDANMQVRGCLHDSAQKIFRGTLDFRKGAKGSVGRENEEIILLSDTARTRSVPLMLSHESDVDGHHAVSIGQIDAEKLFYLQSRGLDLAKAQRLIVEASFAPVLSRIDDNSNLKDEIYSILQRRLAK